MFSCDIEAPLRRQVPHVRRRQATLTIMRFASNMGEQKVIA
jgi:hypothetical protein